jgi:hypothetical protein
MLSSVDATFVGGLLPLRPEFGVRDNVAHIEILNDSRIVGTLSVPLRIGTHVATLDLAAAPEREAETPTQGVKIARRMTAGDEGGRCG